MAWQNVTEIFGCNVKKTAPVYQDLPFIIE